MTYDPPGRPPPDPPPYRGQPQYPQYPQYGGPPPYLNGPPQYPYGPPQYPYGMQPPPNPYLQPGAHPGGPLPTQVNVASILLFVAAGFLILFGLFLLALASVGLAFLPVSALLCVLGGVHIWFGVALRRRTSWARVAAIVLALIGALLSAAGMLRGESPNLPSLALDIAVIVLLTRPEAVRAFDRPKR